jgi:hypothetical protein
MVKDDSIKNGKKCVYKLKERVNLSKEEFKEFWEKPL